MTDSTHSIRRSAGRFFSGTLISRVAGMLRDIAMAYAFGTEASIASFMLAFRFSHLLRRLFGEGALQSTFAPEFESLRQQSPTRAFTFFRDLAVVLTLFLSLLIIFCCTGLGFLLAYGQLQPSNQEIVFLTLLMLPSLLFICLYGLNASLLQCEKSFFTPSVAPVAFNGIWILVVLLLKETYPQQAMPLLSLGVILACLFQWLMTVPKTFSLLKNHLPSLWKGIRLTSPDLFKLSKPLLLGMIGVAASQVNNAMDSVFARYAQPEGPALLWYATRIQQLPLALFGIALAGAILPPLSRAIKGADWPRYQGFLNDALKQTITLMLPIIAVLFIMGDSCINLLYGHGDFGPTSIANTTRCLWAYNLGLLPSTLILILAPAYYAQSNYRLPALASFLAMGLNFLLNSWMIIGLELGAVSVAVATSISAWVNLFFLTRCLSTPQFNPLFSSSLLSYFAKVSLAVLIASGTTLSLRHAFFETNIWHILIQKPVLFQTHFSDQVWELLIQAACFSLIFGLTAFLFGLIRFHKKLLSF